MILRDKYLNILIKNKNNGFPKVITGIRRCGKSYLLEEIYKEYLISIGVKKQDILIIALDDDENIELRDPINLGNYVRKKVNNKKMCYVILDEIQKVYSLVNPTLTNGEHVLAKKDDKEIITFVDVVLGLSREKNIDLYVTGSNSKMLSKDIVTEFRDKATNIYISPLSFNEFLEYKKIYPMDALNEYMIYGGMPLAVLKDMEDKKVYLKNLFSTLYFKDILERNNYRKTESLDELCNILSSCVGQLINSKKLADTFKSIKKVNIDDETVLKMINSFEDAYIIDEAKRYDLKGKNIVGSLRKYYFTDCGLRNARLNFAFPDKGQMLENIIYNELKYYDYNINVGTFDSLERNKDNIVVRNTYEIDFFANKNNKYYYIQVCDNINSYETHLREIKPFILLNDQVQKIIIVNENINEFRDENGYTIIGIIDFLTRFIK